MEKKNLIWLCVIFFIAAAAAGMLIYTCKDVIDIVKSNPELIVENDIKHVANDGAKNIIKIGPKRIVKIDPSYAGVKYERRKGLITTCSGLIEYDTTTTELYTYPVRNVRLGLPSFMVNASDAVGLEITPQVTYEIDDLDEFLGILDFWETESTMNPGDYVWSYMCSYLYDHIKSAYHTVIYEYSFNALMHENSRQFDENTKREINEKVKSKLNRLFGGYVEIISIDYDCPLPEHYRQCVFEMEKSKEELKQAEKTAREAKKTRDQALKEAKKAADVARARAEKEAELAIPAARELGNYHLLKSL